MAFGFMIVTAASLMGMLLGIGIANRRLSKICFISLFVVFVITVIGTFLYTKYGLH